MQIDGQFTIAAPPAVLMQHLFDAGLMASCLPGCESLQALDADRYRAVVVVALAGIKARFDLEVQVTEHSERSLRAITRGEEGGNASQLQADSRFTLEPAGEGTRLSYQCEVSLTGRLGRFALGMMKKKAQAMGDEFAHNLQNKLLELHPAAAAEPAVQPSTAPTAMPAPPPLPWWRAFWNWLLGRHAVAGGPGA